MKALKTLRLPRVATMREQRPAWTHLLAQRSRARRRAVDAGPEPIGSPLAIGGCVLWLDAGAGTLKPWMEAPSSGGGTINYGSGGYAANGLTHAIRVYPFKLSGTPVFSGAFLQVEVSDDSSTYDYAIQWSWDSVTGADGYRVLKSDPSNGLAFDHFVDVYDTTFNDLGPGTFTPGAVVTPFDLSAAGNGEVVAQWNDQSGSGHHATRDDVAGCPMLVTGAVNGRAALRFDAIDDGLVTPLALGTPCTVFVVYAFRGVENTGRRAVQGTNNWLIGPYTLKHEFFTGYSFTGGPDVVQNVFVAQAARDTGAQCRNWVNGAFVGATVGGGVGPGTLTLGMVGAFPEPLNGDIAEVIAYNTALSDADMARVWDYLAARYALS